MKILVLILTLFFALSVFGQQKMSDREADGLKGKVKSVTTSRNRIESKNYADNTLKKFRDEIEIYDRNGTITERTDYEYNSKSLYTFIDGDLTMKSSQIVKKPQNEGIFITSGEEEEKPVKPADKRYDIKFKYKYDDKGRRTETTIYSNTDNVFNRIEYDYDEKGFLKEERRYDDGKTLNDQYFYKYDTNGNLTESKQVLHRPNKNIISFLKYSDFKLDSQGNWTTRTATSLGEFQGKELKTVTKQSRRIVYYK